MEMWGWLKKLFTPQNGVGGRQGDSQLAWTSSSSREDNRDVFDDTYFSASGGQSCNDDSTSDTSDSSSSDCSSDSGSSGGDGD